MPKLFVMFIFQNSSLTWYTDDPDFTNCFEKTVLVWVPCLFLWTFASLEVYYISNSKKRDIRWNFLNITKLLSTVLLIVLSFADLATNFAHIKSEVFKVYDVDIYTPVIKVISFVSINHRLRNKESSFSNLVFAIIKIIVIME